ncbi:MAG: hypothetical protein LBU00_00185 [Treponema sp.]|jgi:hypothetical protein|nr:hypothetical protein [Treponema sp.]
MSNFLVMAWLLSLGFVPNSSLETKGVSIQASDYLVQTLGVGFYLADHIGVYSSVEIQETKSHGVYFDPFRSDFLIGGEVYFKSLSIGVSHECDHDIVTGINFHDYNGWESSFEKAYINYFLPVRAASGITITPSITLADQFTERVRIKSSDKKHYFDRIGSNVSPNIFIPEFGLEIECLCLRSRAAFQAGYAIHKHEWAHNQFKLGAELFYKNISLGVDYTNRKNKQEKGGYSLESLTLFVLFRGESSLL